MSLNMYVRALTPLIPAKSNKNLQSREGGGPRETKGEERREAKAKRRKITSSYAALTKAAPLSPK